MSQIELFGRGILKKLYLWVKPTIGNVMPLVITVKGMDPDFLISEDFGPLLKEKDKKGRILVKRRRI